MATAKERFELACSELGWGDAERGLWFLGIEEGSEWGEGDEQRIEHHYAHRLYFRNDALEAKREPNRATNKSRIDVVEAKIAYPLSRSAGSTSFEQYREGLWSDGSKVAHGNLYPLGKRALSKWPEHYAQLFGYGANDADHRRYRSDVWKIRVARYAAARAELRPQAIVCLGTTHRNEFRGALGLAAPGREAERGKVYVYDEERVILAPHFAYGHLPDARTALISAILKEWGVDLP